MSFESLANSITTYFETLAVANNYTVRYDDDPRKTPVNGLWCEVSIDFGSNEQKEIGINSFREVGNLTVKIKSEIGLGLNSKLIVADVIATAFRRIDVDSVVIFKVPRIVKVGRVEDNFQVNVICPFQYD
ncbi:unnamed protein product, partial [marine sediment metagenome]